MVASCTGSATETLAKIKSVEQIKSTTPYTPKRKKRIIVAVIDTGLDSSLMNKEWVCPTGHKDFTGTGLQDNHSHGTHVSGLIDQYAKDFIFLKHKDVKPSDIDSISVDYCQIIIKYYDPKYKSDNLQNTIKAFRWAIDQHVDIINYSGGGVDASEEEKAVVQEALNKGIKFVAAAGNERSNIDEKKYYPAMYDSRIFIVANLVDYKVEKIVKKIVDKQGTITITETTKRNIASSSNYGLSISDYELGTNLLSRLPSGTYGYMTGTSQATAVKTGKIIKEMMSH